MEDATIFHAPFYSIGEEEEKEEKMQTLWGTCCVGAARYLIEINTATEQRRPRHEAVLLIYTSTCRSKSPANFGNIRKTHI